MSKNEENGGKIMQSLKVEVPVPKDMVLITKVEYESMLDQSLKNRVWTAKDLVEASGRSMKWLKENVLYPYREELDYLNGGFVRYPEKKGQPWKFGAQQMKGWLDEHIDRVL